MNIATGSAASFQTAIELADSKAAMLLVFHPAASLLILSQWSQPDRWFAASTIVTAAGILLFALGFVISGWHIYQVIRPRTGPRRPYNRFTFPAVADPRCPSVVDGSMAELADEAWELASTLARVANTKYHHVGFALRWIVSMVAGTALVVVGSSLP